MNINTCSSDFAVLFSYRFFTVLDCRVAMDSDAGKCPEESEKCSVNCGLINSWGPVRPNSLKTPKPAPRTLHGRAYNNAAFLLHKDVSTYLLSRVCAVAPYAVLEANGKVNGIGEISHPLPTLRPIWMSLQIYHYVRPGSRCTKFD